MDLGFSPNGPNFGDSVGPERNITRPLLPTSGRVPTAPPHLRPRRSMPKGAPSVSDFAFNRDKIHLVMRDNLPCPR
jgi:hypothetical protein